MVRCLVKFSFSFFREEMVEGILKRVSQIFLPSMFPRFSLFLYFLREERQRSMGTRESFRVLCLLLILFSDPTDSLFHDLAALAA